MSININERPLVTVAFFAYNSDRFMREAVESVFAQTYSPLEIILSDDCSTDGTFEIIRELASRYHGPHRIVVNRNLANLGGSEHVNRLLEMARGEFIVQVEGDDISVPERAEKLVGRWLATRRVCDLVCSYFAEIDEASVPTGFVKQEVMFVPDMTSGVRTWRCGATGATASYTPKLYRKYGPLHRDVHSVDWVMPFRAWLEGGVEVIREPLVKHRTHSRSASQIVKNLENVRERPARYALRLKVQAGQLAITREWLKAWRIARKGKHPRVEVELEQLVRLQSAQLDAFDAALPKKVRLLGTVLRLGGLRAALGLAYRHILGVY